MTHDFNIFYTYQFKGEASKIVLQAAVSIIRNQFNAKVIFIQFDKERSLENNFNEFIQNVKIIYKLSVPDISDQNGYLEKKEHLLCIKTRVLRIETNLPEYLWPWIVQTTGYSMNCTFFEKT